MAQIVTEMAIGDTPYIVNGHEWDQEADGFVSYVSVKTTTHS